MSNSSAGLQVSQAAFQDAQGDRLLRGARTSIKSTASPGAEDAKIQKAGKDFESILLGSWLQQAEQSFAKVPGGDGQDEDDDSGKDQFQGIAMQALAGSLTASGGIGIAKMITSNLRASSQHKSEPAADAKVAAPMTQVPANR